MAKKVIEIEGVDIWEPICVFVRLMENGASEHVVLEQGTESRKVRVVPVVK